MMEHQIQNRYFLLQVDDVYVQIWYDQSGEGNDATQVSASAQTQIVSSGPVITENGEPSVEFNETTN